MAEAVDDIKGPWLAIQSVNGAKHYAIEWFKNTMSKDGYPTFRIAVLQTDAEKGIDFLKKKYEYQIKNNGSVDPATVGTEEQKAERIKILVGIITTSNQEGEIEAAKRVYKRTTGNEWVAPL